jgi:hypothetical protein
MFIFSPPSELTDLDRIEDRANPPVASVGLPLATTIALGGLGMVAGGPIVGGCLAALPCYAMLKRLSKSFRNSVYLNANPGNYAHLIKSDRDMIAYLEIHGRDEVRNQLIHADKSGQRLSGCAKRTYAKLVDIKPYKKVTEFLEAEKPATTASTDQKSTQAQDATTQTTVQQQSQKTGQAQDAKPYQPAGYFDPNSGKGSIVLDMLVQSPGISRLFIGGQRTGKSYLAAVASRELAKQGCKIFHVNLASYGTEDDYYWQHVYKSVRGDLATITDADKAQDLIAAAIDLMTEFVSSQNAILLVDEVAFAGSKYGKWDASSFLRLVAEQISALTSTGMKRERAIWGLCPELVAGSMKDSTKAIKSLQLVYIAIAPGMTIDWSGQKVKFDESVHQQVTANFKGVELPTPEQVSICRRHNLPRIAYLNGEWLPIGELPKIEQPTIAKPSAYAVVSTPTTIEPTLIDAELPALYETIARMTVAQNFTTEFDDDDAAWQLISEEPNTAKREALEIAYRWALSRQESVGKIERSDFLNRARAEKKSDYLRDNRDALWPELQALIS